MRPHDCRRRQWTDLPFEACLYGIRLSCIRHETYNLFRLQDLPNAHRNSAFRHILKGWEPSCPQLLSPASFIQSDHNVRLFRFEISRWVIEREMAVLPDSNEGYIDGSRDQFPSDFANHFCRVFLSMEQMVLRNARFPNQSLLQKLAEARWMRLGQPDVLIQVEHLHPLPIDIRQRRKHFQKLKLRRPRSCDQSRPPVIRNGGA